MPEYLMGIDIGTGGCKVTLIDTDGRFISDGYSEYPSYHPHLGWVEQKPEDWITAVVRSLNKAVNSAKIDPLKIIGLTADASAHNMVILDKNGCILRDTIMWLDQRATQETDFLKTNYLDLIQSKTFSTPSPTWSLPQLLWIRNNQPDIYSKIAKIMFIDDYVRYRLTNCISTTNIQAQGSLFFDNTRMQWSDEIMSLTGLPIAILPEVKRATDISGYLTKDAAALLGLKEGIPVIMGASDTSLESYSVGGIKQGDCVLKMATAGGINVFRDKGEKFEDTFVYSHVVDNMWYYARGTVSAAQALRWYRDTFCQQELALEKRGGKNTYYLLDQEAEKIAPGSNGVFFHPYMSGERSPYWDAKLRASFTGFSSIHTRGHFNRAILEGVTYSLKQCFSVMETFGKIEKISFVGGGAKSSLWRSIVADVFNRPIVKYKRDDSSLGGAMLTGVALGIFQSHEDAVRKTAEIDCITQPDPERVEIYRKYYPLYIEIHDDLVNTYRKYEDN